MKCRACFLWLNVALACSIGVRAETLTAASLGVIYNVDDANSKKIAFEYAAQRNVPLDNLIGIHAPTVPVWDPAVFGSVRSALVDRLPSAVQALLLVWSKPYAVGCMSVTTAIAAGYKLDFCRSGCVATLPNLLFDSDGWLPADTVGWWPAMLLPSDDLALARAIVKRGVAADATNPPGTVYLVDTPDKARNVRAASYDRVKLLFGHQMNISLLSAPVVHPVVGALGYFTGAREVAELNQIDFRPGAIADHLTSTGGILTGGRQMSAEAWLKQGATASYGSVSEPCNILGKFPDIAVLLQHYSHGEPLLEAYWKSVAMPGQGLFIGEPLSRPFAGSL